MSSKISVQSYPISPSECDRLDALHEYHLVDTPPEEDFDRLVSLAAKLFKVPIVLISLIDRDRQFFKARVGLEVCETSRDVSFCAHAINQEEILVVTDAAKDPRFCQNPLVIGPPFIRFYAGQQLISPSGAKIGTVCLIDTKPGRRFGIEDRKNLAELSLLVMDHMEIRRLDYVRTISQARFENIAATSPDAIICSNAEGDVTFWNRAAEKLFGYSVDEVLNRPGGIIIPDSWCQIYESELDHLRKGEHMELADRTIELSGLRKDGTEFPAEFSLSTWREGNTMSVGAIVRDITERRQNEERLFRLACVDALTELPNRAAWRDELEKAVSEEVPVTVLLIDLDGFKEVNDTLGHSAGDFILKETANRLAKVCNTAIMIGRLGGDEFVALLKGNDKRFARVTASELVSEISKPYELAGRSCQIGASIGIAFFPSAGTTAEDILGAADLALYRAKASGKARYQFFDPTLREVMLVRRKFEIELKQAFENGEFELFYQPQFATDGYRLTGAEALIRWNHPQRGLLAPASFIDVLSHKPSAGVVGEWILKTACIQAAEWRKQVTKFRIGVNLFDVQFRSGRLLTSVREALSESGLPASALELEIVETILMKNDQATLKLLKALRSLGVGLAFDDYGTGFASLSFLKRYPVNRLKIDRSFVRDVNNDIEDAAVVQAILYLGRSFGMEVIAEGVETEAQLKFLKQNGCKEAQGYLFGKPMPAKEFSGKFIMASAASLVPIALPRENFRVRS